MEQNRFTSPVLWSSLTAQVLVILVTLGVIDTGMSDAIKTVITSVLQLLVAFGILNNPTDKAAF